eukprot:scaffold66045_cov29-Prasinocladus_malaysianus.AAC.1
MTESAVSPEASANPGPSSDLPPLGQLVLKAGTIHRQGIYVINHAGHTLLVLTFFLTACAADRATRRKQTTALVSADGAACIFPAVDSKLEIVTDCTVLPAAGNLSAGFSPEGWCMTDEEQSVWEECLPQQRPFPPTAWKEVQLRFTAGETTDLCELPALVPLGLYGNASTQTQHQVALDCVNSTDEAAYGYCPNSEGSMRSEA